MKWIHIDEWYCWSYNEGRKKPSSADTFKEQYARVPDALAKRFDAALKTFRSIQEEIDKYAGKDEE